MKIRYGITLACTLLLAACATAPETPPPPAPIAPPPSLAPGEAPLPENYILFFDFNSVELSEVAQAVIARAAADAMRADPARIEIAGYTGEGEGARTGPVIATQRYEAVADALVAAGVDRALIVRVALEDDPQLPAVAIRRIEIRFGTAPPAS